MTRQPVALSTSLTLALGLLLHAHALAVTVCKDGTCNHTSIGAALLDVDHKGENVIITKPGIFEESGLWIGGTSQGGPRILMSLNNDPTGTIIDATGSEAAVVTCLTASTIRGITLRGGKGGVRLCFGGGSTLDNVIIENNVANGEGGGLQASWGPMTVINSTFRNNTASSGGAISMNAQDTLTIRDSTFEDNKAVGDGSRARGGAVAVSGLVSMLVEDSDFIGNQVTSPLRSSGGAIKAGSTTILNNVNLLNNSVFATSGISDGGGIYKTKETNSGPLLEINGGTISGNMANKGGGIWVGINATLDLFGGSVTGNTSRDDIADGSGGGVYCASTSNKFLAAGHISGNTPDQVFGCGLPMTGTTRTQADNDNSGDSNDPVNMRTGELFKQYDPDINLGGPMPLYFARYYSSGFEQVGIIANLGDNWRHNFDWSLLQVGSDIDILNHQGRTIQFAWDGAKWELVGKIDVVYQLSENAGVFTLLDPGDQRTYLFDSEGRLTNITDGKGHVHVLSYASGPLIQVVDVVGRILHFSYDDNNQLTSVSDGLGRSVIFTYAITDPDLISVTDINGHTTTYVYATGGTLTNQSLLFATDRPLGNRPYKHFFWFSDLKVFSEFDVNNNETKFAYPSASETEIEDPLGIKRSQVHAAAGGLSENTDQAGYTTLVAYDAAGRRSVLTDKSGNEVLNGYDSLSGEITSITLPGGDIVDFTYTPRVHDGVTYFDHTGVAYPDGSSEAFAFDSFGNMTSHTDQRQKTRTFAYTPTGERLSKTNKLGGVVSYTYNADQTLATRTDDGGETTSYEYDLFKRLTLVTYPDGTSQTFNRDSKGLLLSETDERGSSTSIDYDNNDNVISVTDVLGNTTTFIYDDGDRLLEMTDELGNTSTRVYNELGQVVEFTDPNGNFATFGYDSRGHLNLVADSAGNTWLSQHDADGFVSSNSDPLGNTVTFLRDSKHRITRRTDALGKNTDVVYDLMGRISSTTDALANETSFTYDANGQVASVNLPDGATTTYVRNDLGQITRLIDPNGKNWDSTYDKTGRKTAVTDPLGNVTSLSYDSDNRALLASLPDAMGTLNFTYDDAGNATRLLYSDGTDLNFTYDAQGRATTANGMTQTYDVNGRITNSNGIDNTYDAGGRLISMTLATGKTVTYDYDANNQVTTITDWSGGVTTFSYDFAGRLTGVVRPNGVNLANSYDNNSRLIELAESGISSIQLKRNANGQIVAAVRDVPQSDSANGLSDRIFSFDAASQIMGNSYDKMGRKTAAGPDSYVWDLASRLAAYTISGITTTNSYDALGRRTRRVGDAVTSDYVWNDALELPSISIEQRSSTDFRYFIHTPDGQLLYSMDAASNARSFYHFDEMGNTIFISNNAGAVTSSYAYSPYGELTASSGTLDIPFTWQGEQGVVNEGNGLYYM